MDDDARPAEKEHEHEPTPAREPSPSSSRAPSSPPTPIDEKQCRICYDGPSPTLGRLIRPCLCRGSISVRRSC
jgi:hypothetical protein